MRSLCLLFVLALFSGCTQEKSIRHKIADAFGGLDQMRRMDDVKYSVVRYKISGKDTLTETRWYRLSIKRGSFEEMRLIERDTIVSTYANGQSSITRQGRTTVTDSVANRALHQSMYYNFLYLLVAEHTTWAIVGNYELQGKPALVVSVKDNQRKADEIHLFLDPQSWQILSSSTPENGHYPYFANEYEYRQIPCLSISFPMRYEVVVDGKLTSWGIFEGFCD